MVVRLRSFLEKQWRAEKNRQNRASVSSSSNGRSSKTTQVKNMSFHSSNWQKSDLFFDLWLFEKFSKKFIMRLSRGLRSNKSRFFQSIRTIFDTILDTCLAYAKIKFHQNRLNLRFFPVRVFDTPPKCPSKIRLFEFRISLSIRRKWTSVHHHTVNLRKIHRRINIQGVDKCSDTPVFITFWALKRTTLEKKFFFLHSLKEHRRSNFQVVQFSEKSFSVVRQE